MLLLHKYLDISELTQQIRLSYQIMIELSVDTTELSIFLRKTYFWRKFNALQEVFYNCSIKLHFFKLLWVKVEHTLNCRFFFHLQQNYYYLHQKTSLNVAVKADDHQSSSYAYNKSILTIQAYNNSGFLFLIPNSTLDDIIAAK